MNSSDPGGTCTSKQNALEYRLCISFDEGLEFLILIGGGSYSVNQDFAETIMSINGQNQPGQAQATAESFKGDIRLTRFSPNTLLWRYTTSDNQYGNPFGWFLSPTYYQSSSLVQQDLALPPRGVPYEYVWQVHNPLPALALYGEVAPQPWNGGERGGGEQVAPLSPEEPIWEHHLFGAVDIELTASISGTGVC